MKGFKPAENYEKEKRNLRSTIVLAVFVAGGVNLIVSGLTKITGAKAWHFILTGVFIILFCIVWYCANQFRTLQKSKVIQGFFLYNRNTKELVDIPNYDILLWMRNHMNSASPMIKEIWENEEISRIKIKDGRFCIERTEADTIFCELLEYVLLEKFSAVLQDYYVAVLGGKTVTYNREDLRPFLKNRFVNWFSEGSDNHEVMQALKGIRNQELDAREMIPELMAMIKVSKPYHRFQFALPKGCSLVREKNKIVLRHKFFLFELKYGFNGSNANTPMYFDEWYLGKKHNECQAFQFDISLDIQFSFLSLFSRRAKKFYSWADTFADDLSRFASMEEFFNRIEWNAARTVVICAENWQRN